MKRFTSPGHAQRVPFRVERNIPTPSATPSSLAAEQYRREMTVRFTTLERGHRTDRSRLTRPWSPTDPPRTMPMRDSTARTTEQVDDALATSAWPPWPNAR